MRTLLICLTLSCAACSATAPTATSAPTAIATELAEIEAELRSDVRVVSLPRAGPAPITSQVVLERLRSAGLLTPLREDGPTVVADPPRALRKTLIPLARPRAIARFESFGVGDLELPRGVLLAVIREVVPPSGRGGRYYGVFNDRLMVHLVPHDVRRLERALEALSAVLLPD